MEVKMEHPANFRDMGGIRGADARSLRPKRLLRSGEVRGLSAGERQTLLEDFDLKTIVDMRSDKEQQDTPDETFPGVAYVPIDILQGMRSRAGSLANFEKITSAQQAAYFMAKLYEETVRDALACKGYRQFLDVLLAQKEGAVLFHCFAGKDRTGIGAAIALTLLGAAWEDIEADYLRTNQLRAAENARLVAAHRQRGLDDEQLAAFETTMLVDAAYLEAGKKAAEEDYGSFWNYCTQGIGVSQAEIDTLRGMYLE